jgi:glucose dehydrogenase
MTAVNAFDWKAYTEEEHAKRGDPFKQIKRNAVISANVTEGIHKIRKKNPSHGTIFGITEKRLSVKAPEMMYAKAKN